MFESKIECLCGWSWKESEGGKDKFICHKCGRDTLKQNLILSFKRNNTELNKILKSIDELKSKVIIRTKEDSIVIAHPRKKKTCEISYYYGKITVDWINSRRLSSEFENIESLMEFIKKNF